MHTVDPGRLGNPVLALPPTPPPAGIPTTGGTQGAPGTIPSTTLRTMARGPLSHSYR